MDDMGTSLTEILEQEHRDIDAGLGSVLEGLEQGQTRVAEEQRQRLQDFLDSGTMPEGWACRMA